MDELALSIELNILGMRWSSLDPLLRIFASIVFIGVAVEVGWVVRDWLHDLRDFERGTIHPPNRPEGSDLFWGLFGSVLVTAGILGELLVGIEAGKVEAEMRDTTGKLVALVNEKAGKANERAAELERESLLLQKQLIAQGSRSVLLWGRRRKDLVEKLKPFAGQKAEIRHCRISFTQNFIDNEAMSLVMALQSVLSNEGKWSVNPLAQENLLWNWNPGIRGPKGSGPGTQGCRCVVVGFA